MRYLLDTNILIRLPHRADPEHQVIRDALRSLREAGHTFVTTRQNAAEFVNVCTRPASARGGLGLSSEETMQRLRLLERGLVVLADPPSAYEKWKSLVVKYGVMGVQVHDARIAETMMSYRIKRILTLNEADFARDAGITAVTPAAVLA